ncbi:replication-relaxation family protein [Embleya sp. NBC_00896]|uniref:replication-relaxation family protein n=1 Tax=Embleya sp. NBC_00896 TaxID=2975961 RepID=UPI002F9103BB|nr:replication-relaxation family protein [Embleya sp. NBC_00896]
MVNVTSRRPKPTWGRAHRDRALGLKSPSRQAHLIGVNGFHTTLEARARTHPDTNVKRWSGSEARWYGPWAAA